MLMSPMGLGGTLMSRINWSKNAPTLVLSTLTAALLLAFPQAYAEP